MKPNGKEGANGKGRIRDALASAEPAPAPSNVPEAMLKKFVMLENGLHRRADDALVWLSDPFKLEAEWEDEAGNWGFLLTFLNRNWVKRELFPGRAEFSGDCGPLRAKLAAAGLAMNPNQTARSQFAEFLNASATPNRAHLVSRAGWHEMGGMKVFALPDRTIGAKSRVILANSGQERMPFRQAGTLAEWRDHVSVLALGNSRLLFGISCALAGPLLYLAGEDGGGLNLRGGSRIGKTTCLRLSTSVWGDRNFGRSSRATGNGLEGTAAIHSDTLLALDEMAEVDAKEIGEISYLLSNGTGRTRADRSGAMRAPVRFRILFLSGGEVSLQDKNAEARKVTRAGMEVRFCDLPADTGVHGIFENLHEAESAAAFAEELRHGTARYFGKAGPEFVQHLVNSLEKDADFPDRLRERIGELVRAWMKPYSDAGAQVGSVARRFALVAAAGEMATEAAITGWAPGDAREACETMFRAWVRQRGSVGAGEDLQAKMQLRDFLSKHADSRFQDWRRGEPQSEDATAEDGVPYERFRIANRAGWRRVQKDEGGRHFYVYYFSLDGMKEALSGLDFDASIKVLVKAGMIQKDHEGKSTVARRPPGMDKPIRLYQVPASIVGAADE